MRRRGARAGFWCRVLATWRHASFGCRVMLILFAIAALVAVV